MAAAFAAVWVRAIWREASVVSYDSADRPAASVGVPSLSVTVMRKAFSSPVALERISRREPLPSVKTTAVTPAPAPLILSRTCASVSVASMLTSSAVLPALAVKLAWLAPQVPSSMRNVPAPGVAELEANTPLASDCAAASDCTVTE